MSDKNVSDFWKCTNTKYDGKRWSIDCRLGLWGVEAPTREQALQEAFRYFEQYKSDGEYSSIIGGKNTVDALIENMKHQ